MRTPAAFAVLAVLLTVGCSPARDRLGTSSPSTSSPSRSGGTAEVGAPATAGANPEDAGAAASGSAVVGTARGGAVQVHDGPDAASPVRVTLQNPTPTGGPLAFHVLDSRAGWLQVDLPIRPNGSTGWIREADLALARTSMRIEIRLAERLLVAFDGPEIVLQEPIGVGRHPTPTPGGSFYLYELLQPPTADGPYGPYAFGLSGFSEALTTFAGGDGRLGIHGTNDPSSIGNDSSAGCIRLPNAAITQLALSAPLGTPVTIRA